MSRKISLFVCFAAMIGVVLVGCNDEENKRSVVTVSSMNLNAPFFSDVIDQGDSLQSTSDDFVAEDWCPVVFKNRPYSSVVFTGPEEPFNDFLITRYRVEWRRVDGGAYIPPPFDGAMSTNVPSGEEVEAAIVLVPFLVKNDPNLVAIRYTSNEFLAVARVTFWGHEVGSNRDQDFSAEISVNFADFLEEQQ
jgi:hypothetical protein